MSPACAELPAVVQSGPMPAPPKSASEKSTSEKPAADGPGAARQPAPGKPEAGKPGNGRPAPAKPAVTVPETVLDLQGLTCPLPVLRANRALRGMPAGARLTVLASDPASVKDFQAYSRETGHALVSFSETAGMFRFTLRRREDRPEDERDGPPAG
jgi:tRNA 2-thiouridine synthesizing protein A